MLTRQPADPHAERQESTAFWLETVTQAREYAKEQIQQNAAQNKQRYDNTAKHREIAAGDAVMLQRPIPANTSTPRKLHSTWVGPFRVLQVYDQVAIIRSVANPDLPPVRAHKNRLRLCDGDRFLDRMDQNPAGESVWTADPNLEAEYEEDG